MHSGIRARSCVLLYFVIKWRWILCTERVRIRINIKWRKGHAWMLDLSVEALRTGTMKTPRVSFQYETYRCSRSRWIKSDMWLSIFFFFCLPNSERFSFILVIHTLVYIHGGSDSVLPLSLSQVCWCDLVIVPCEWWSWASNTLVSC